MPPHNPPGNLAVLEPQLARRFDPDARAYEAFSLGRSDKEWTSLYDPLEAGTLKEALAEATSRWLWMRGDRLGIREISDKFDRLHVYAVRQKTHGSRPNLLSNLEYARWLDHICTIDLDVVRGTARGLIGSEIDLYERRQRQRPEGARR